MSQRTEHIIKAQQYQITLDKEEEAHQVQSQISVLQESQVNDLLNNVLSRYVNSDCIYQFDTVELDLGVISKTNYENQLVFRIEEELVKFLNANIRENGTLRTGRMIVLNDRKLEHFEHFILKGYFNWDSSSSQASSILLKELIKENTEGLVSLLNEHGKKKLVRKRLIYQFDEEALESIVTVVVKTESTYIISYKRNILEQQQKQQFIDTEFTTFRNAVWEVVLAYLFVESSSYYSKKSFLQYLIRKIAVQYNLSYTLLLKVIAEGVNTEPEAAQQLEFRKIILELETENKNKNISPEKKEAVKKKTLAEWIKHLEYYLKHGAFQPAFPFTSKTEFNRHFQLILQTKNAKLVQFLHNGLNDVSKKDRLLQISNDEVLNQIITIVAHPFIKTNFDFVEILSKNRSLLSSHSKTFLARIKEKKGRLIAGAFTKTQLNESDSLLALLHHIKREFSFRETIFFQLLSEAQEKFPPKYRKTVKGFLENVAVLEIHKKQETADEKIMEEISQKIQDFLNSNESELWHYWMNKQVPKWILITGLKKQTLLLAIKASLIKKIARPEVISFVEKEATSEMESHQLLKQKSTGISPVILTLLEKNMLPIAKQTGLFSEWSKAIIHEFQKVAKKYNLSFEIIFESFIQFVETKPSQQDLYQKLIRLKLSSIVNTIETKEEQQHLKNRVEYVLQKGLLPWWTDGYSWEDFNAEFLNLWTTTREQQQLVKLLQQHSKNISLHTILNEDNLYRVWKALDENSEVVYSNLFREMNLFFRQQMLPIGLITTQQYQEIKASFFQFLKPSSTKTTTDELWSLMESWLTSFTETESRSIRNLLIHLLSHIEQTIPSSDLKKEIAARIKSWNTLSINKKEVAKTENTISVNQFLIQHPLAYQWNELPLVNQLEKIMQVAAVEIKTILNTTTLRESLIEELEEKDLLSFIHLNLNINQQQYLRESIAVIEASHSFVTFREWNILKQQYFQLILLKMSAGGFAAWNIMNWTNLLIQCIENVLGKSKSREVFLKISGKLLAEKGDQYKKGMQLLDKIHHVIVEAEELETIQKEEADYRKLGEKKPREFLDPIFIKNAGLIILAPYLGMLFERCGLMQQSEFTNDESRFKAVHLLQYAATGKTGKEEHELVMNKLLCGMTITDPVESNIALTENDKEIVNGLLTAITQQWKPLSGTSIEGLQVSFLQRDGKLEEEEELYFLKIEQKAFDMLLDQISWNISNIKLSWMDKNIVIEWR